MAAGCSSRPAHLPLPQPIQLGLGFVLHVLQHLDLRQGAERNDGSKGNFAVRRCGINFRGVAMLPLLLSYAGWSSSTSEERGGSLSLHRTGLSTASCAMAVHRLEGLASSPPPLWMKAVRPHRAGRSAGASVLVRCLRASFNIQCGGCTSSSVLWASKQR